MELDWYARLDQAAQEWRDALDFAEEMREALAIEVESAINDGVSQRAIADMTGIHRATVRKMLAESGY